jgi:hypothetical protein
MPTGAIAITLRHSASLSNTRASARNRREHAPVKAYEQQPHHGDRHERRRGEHRGLHADAQDDVAPRQHVRDGPAGRREPAAKYDRAAAKQRLAERLVAAGDVEREQARVQRAGVLDGRVDRDEPVVRRRHEEPAGQAAIRQPRQQVLRCVFGDEHRERAAARAGLGGDADARAARHGVDIRRQPAHARPAIALRGHRPVEIDVQRREQLRARARSRAPGVARRARHDAEYAGTRTVVIALDRACAIVRTRRAQVRQHERQRQIARDLVTLRGLAGHADHERLIRCDREFLAVCEKSVDDIGRRRRRLAPDQLRIHHVVDECGFGDLQLLGGLVDAVQEIAPLGVQIAVHDRRDAEPAGDQDQDRDDDAAAEHRNALIAANELERAVLHGAT